MSTVTDRYNNAARLVRAARMEGLYYPSEALVIARNLAMKSATEFGAFVSGERADMAEAWRALRLLGVVLTLDDWKPGQLGERPGWARCMNRAVRLDAWTVQLTVQGTWQAYTPDGEFLRRAGRGSHRPGRTWRTVESAMAKLDKVDPLIWPAPEGT